MTLGAVILAGGQAARFGGVLKQFVRLNGERIADRAVGYARACGAARIVLVAPAGWTDTCGADVIVTAGESRGGSIRAGLAELADSDVVMVHDAARPLADTVLASRCLQAIRAGAAFAVPGIELDDTLASVEDGRVTETAERGGWRRLQTPEFGRRDRILAGFAVAPWANALSDFAYMLKDDVCAVVPGDPINRKITRPMDLYLAEQLRQQQEADTSIAPDVNGRAIAVIGATGTIGQAVVSRLWQLGAIVTPVPRSEWDLREPIPNALIDRLRRSDVQAVVHAAGVMTDDLADTMTVNFASVVELCEHAPVFMTHGGCLVVLGSSAAAHGRPDQPLYAASKAAVNNYVQGIAPALARKGVRLNSVNPCRVASPMREQHGLSVDGAVPIGLVAEVVAAFCSTDRVGQVVHVRRPARTEGA